MAFFRGVVTIAEDSRRKYLTILQNLYSGDRVLIEMGKRAQTKFEEGEQDYFNAFAIDVGNMFIELKEELDQGLEDIADACPEETDPRKWDVIEWATFYKAVYGHEFEEIYRTMAKCEDNINLIWGVIEDRLDLP